MRVMQIGIGQGNLLSIRYRYLFSEQNYRLARMGQLDIVVASCIRFLPRA